MIIPMDSIELFGCTVQRLALNFSSIDVLLLIADN
jgi:hypothetical protein